MLESARPPLHSTGNFCLCFCLYIGGIVSLFLLCVPVCRAQSLSAAEVLPLIQSRNYSQAYPSIKALAEASPKDMSLQYYLGLCALGLKNYPLAELAFCRVIVSRPADDPFVPSARKALASFRGTLNPYCTVQKKLTRRWSRSAMPLKIWVSEGLTLPAPYVGNILTAPQYKEATWILQSLQPLAVAPSYKAEYRQSVLKAFHSWDWAVRDGLISYVFVNNARDADIAVLFVEHPPEQAGGFTLYPYAPHQPCIVEIKCALERNWDEPSWIQQVEHIMAHEFGHALGLADSATTTDLMYPGDNNTVHPLNEVPNNTCSANDCASLRAVYSMPADANWNSVRQ